MKDHHGSRGVPVDWNGVNAVIDGTGGTSTERRSDHLIGLFTLDDLDTDHRSQTAPSPVDAKESINLPQGDDRVIRSAGCVT
jgi:hypothetical protein